MFHHQFFEGWYLKHQGEEQAFAVIPALHYPRAGKRTATLQIITADSSDCVTFSGEEIRIDTKNGALQLGANYFGRDGIRLCVKGQNISAEGALSYGEWLPPHGAVMGPFGWIPGLPCYHQVDSLYHPLQGIVQINGQQLSFENGIGYAEGDRGRSFPKSYLWSQCCWKSEKPCSVIAAAAEFLVMGVSITGCVALVLYEGQQWRLSTYQGAKIVRYDEREIELRQKELRLRIALVKSAEQPLQAPQNGKMARIVRESLKATVRYRFWVGEKQVFDITNPWASFERVSQKEE